MNNIEYTICVDCVRWCDIFFARHQPALMLSQYDKHGIFERKISPIYHVTNEGKMSARRGNQTNRMGRRKGMLDYVIPIPRNGYGGIYIEMKKPGEKMTDKNQMEWYHFLKRHNMCVVLDNVNDFKLAVKEYFGLGSK